MRAAVLLAVVAALPLALWAALPHPSPGASAPSLQKKIKRAESAIRWRRGKERVLASDIAGFSRRINRLQGEITDLQRQQVRLQADLDRKRAELMRIQERLRQERARLARLRARLIEARETLSTRLVELYKADKPDMVTVVLEADGFADLLERSEFLKRVSDQDKRIINVVRAAKADATRTTRRLDALEERQQRVTAVVLARRDQVAATRGQLQQRRASYAGARADKAAALHATRRKRQHLEGDLRELEAQQARVLARLQAAQRANAGSFSGSSLKAGPIRQGSGSLIWPVNGPVVSPYGPRWGRLHAGVDIAAPAGTPIRAAGSGRVVLLGWTGGYGNYTCIQHTATMSTCYAHQSSYATSNGASVARGQVIGSVGCTGHCFGDHLHFEVRINGSPVDPLGYL